jgi:DNA invertase Pin-like site-specific DNA recombinase
VGVGHLIRVSTALQRKRSIGSQKFQKLQVRHLAHLAGYGIDVNRVRLYDATGESARAGARRPVFRKLVEDIRNGEIALVIVTDVDRIARNDPDAEQIFSALQAVGGLIMINGELYDPGNHIHRMILGIRGVIARFENDQRVFRCMTAKLARAHDLEFPVPLATGLIWGSPDDPEFCKKMEEAGLQDRLSQTSLDLHRTGVMRNGRRLFVFPYPDRDVVRATQLAFEWLLETKDLGAVLERIASHPEWPHPGKFPVIRSRWFDPESPPEWRVIVGRADGKDDLARNHMYSWFRRPSLYGTYAFRSPALGKLPHSPHPRGSEVWVDHAFPGLASPEDRPLVLEALKNPLRPRIRGEWRGPRNHWIPIIRCACFLPDGSICGHKLSPLYTSARAGRHRYRSIPCDARGHGFSVPGDIDNVVLDLVLTVFTRERLEHELSRIRVDQGRDAHRAKEIEADLAKLQAKVTWCDDQAFEAKHRGDFRDMEFYNRRRRELQEQIGELARELRRARAAVEQAARVTERECTAILDLATDLPALIKRARHIEGKVRELLAEIIRCVYVRPLGTYTYHVEAEFHSGERLAQLWSSIRVPSPQPIGLLAWHRLGRWIVPNGIATVQDEEEARATANALANDITGAVRLRHTAAWTGDRLLGAAASRPDWRKAPRPTRHHETTEELASRLGVPEQDVTAAALCGELGDASLRNDTLVFRPNDRQLHRAFKSVALRSVAEKTGWPEDEILLLEDLRRETGWSWERVTSAARWFAGIARDAAGRRYTRRSSIPILAPGELDEILERSIPPGADRKNGRWVTYAQASKELPGVNIGTFESHTAVIRPGAGPNGIKTAYVWLDPQVVERVYKPTLEEAITRLGRDDLRPDDFVLREPFLAQLRRRFGYPSRPIWMRAAGAGRILEVRARAPGRRTLAIYAFVPPAVRNATDIEVVRAFIRGDLALASNGAEDRD